MTGPDGFRGIEAAAFLDVPRAAARAAARPFVVPEYDWPSRQRRTAAGRPPPEVLAAFADLGPGGNWEGGTVDQAGRRWSHLPWKGWQLAGPDPYQTASGWVYTSAGIRRRRRRETVVRWVVPHGGLLALLLIYRGLVDMALGWAAAGAALAVLLVALVWWGLADGRPW